MHNSDTKVEKYPTVEEVDDHLLKRFDNLVQDANAEDMARLLDSWSKYVAARKNSDVFGKAETPEEKQQREVAEILEGEING